MSVLVSKSGEEVKREGWFVPHQGTLNISGVSDAHYFCLVEVECDSPTAATCSTVAEIQARARDATQKRKLNSASRRTAEEKSQSSKGREGI